MLSVMGAALLNFVIAINHRPRTLRPDHPLSAQPAITTGHAMPRVNMRGSLVKSGHPHLQMPPTQ